MAKYSERRRGEVTGRVSEPFVHRQLKAASIEGEASEPTYADELAAALHESLEGLASLGAVDEAVVKEFEKVAVVPVPAFSPARVRELRLQAKATQAVFALHLGVSVNTVSQWERGERQVTGAAAKLLSLVEKHGLAYLV